jgi:hypothetical protein
LIFRRDRLVRGGDGSEGGGGKFRRGIEAELWKFKNCLARPKRFELLTPRFVVWCSIQLSYGRGAP